MGKRVDREKHTVLTMIRIYCKAKHGTDGHTLCPDCAALAAYAVTRLSKCRFGDSKPACRRCAIHCYRPDMREQIRKVMRFSGPRMILRSPLEIFRHIWR